MKMRMNHMAMPSMNIALANGRSFQAYVPTPFGEGSMYGMAMSPTMIMLGSSTPAIHGSKYTSSSWRPTKYQGALEGLGVMFALATSSRGAFDQTLQAKM